jgi:beta-lactam-binding protein with PASTA domain
MIRVPDLSEMQPGEAFQALWEADLRPVLIGMPTMKTDGNQSYRVAAQDPSPATEVDAGTRVALAFAPHILSFGTLMGPPVAPPGTVAPNVVGRGIEEAMQQVTAAGLIAVVFQPSRAVETITVSRQEPAPSVAVGSFREVALWLD